MTRTAISRLGHIVFAEIWGTLGAFVLITGSLWPPLYYVPGFGPQMAQNFYYGSFCAFWGLFFMSILMIRVGLTFCRRPSALPYKGQQKDRTAKYYAFAVFPSLYLILSFLGCRAVGLFGHHIRSASPFLLQGSVLIALVMLIMIAEQLVAKRRKRHLLTGSMLVYHGLILMLFTLLLPLRSAIIQ